MRRLMGKFVRDQRGTVLVETLIAVPVLTLVTFGIMEFGSLMWQRQQLQVGVRDAARYWSRCSNLSFTSGGCSLARAQNIAFYGNPDGNGPTRVPDWDNAVVTTELTITPATPPTNPTAADIVIVQGTVTYTGTPFYSAIFGNSFDIGYYHTMRNQGW